MVSCDGARAHTETSNRNGISTALKVPRCKGAAGCSSSTGLGESPKKIRIAPCPSVATWLQNSVARRGEVVATPGGCFLSARVPGACGAPYPWVRAASLRFCSPSRFAVAQRAISSLQTLTHLPMDPEMGHIHCSAHVGGQRNAEEIATWTRDGENSLILGSFTAAQSGRFWVGFNLIWIGRAAPEEGRIMNNTSFGL